MKVFYFSSLVFSNNNISPALDPEKHHIKLNHTNLLCECGLVLRGEWLLRATDSIGKNSKFQGLSYEIQLYFG